MFPILLILVGLAVLAFGRRLSVLGASVGALLGVSLLRLFPGSADPWLQIAVVGGLAVLGFLFAGFARGIVDIVILVLSALAGAAIVLGVLDLFSLTSGALDWLLAIIGGVVAVVVIRRFRRGTKDWGLIILAGLVGALLVTRGLVLLLPSLQGLIIPVLGRTWPAAALPTRRLSAPSAEMTPQRQSPPPQGFTLWRRYSLRF
ncbi:MAG: hypothetical protein KIS91_09380 [Anaerolineae bacterium]|nr:hypothetical protein [Anaerolineae bacterium]